MITEGKRSVFLSLLLGILILLLVVTELTQSQRVKGRFDRFGKNKKRVHLGHYRSPQSLHYYNNQNGAKIVKASHFETEYELGKKVVFFCTAVGQPTPIITWYKDGVEIFDHRWFLIHEWLDDDKATGLKKIKSKMEIDPATQADRGEYECLADNMYAFDRRRFRTDYIEMD